MSINNSFLLSGSSKDSEFFSSLLDEFSSLSGKLYIPFSINGLVNKVKEDSSISFLMAHVPHVEDTGRAAMKLMDKCASGIIVHTSGGWDTLLSGNTTVVLWRKGKYETIFLRPEYFSLPSAEFIDTEETRKRVLLTAALSLIVWGTKEKESLLAAADEVRKHNRKL